MSHGPDRPIRFGTRGSALALAQTTRVIDRVRAAYPKQAAEIVTVRTEGDIDVTSPLTAIGGRGVFTSEIEAALLRGRVDAAVHSAKDLPSTLHPGAPIVAFPDRDDPRDVLVSRHGVALDRLPANPVIGTSSRRREAQIRRLRPDARIVSIRGNIDTRLRLAASMELDAVVLAAAGIRRLGWEDRISEVFAVERLVPAPGQGAIAVQARLASDVGHLLQAIDDPTVATMVSLERAFLAAIDAGCSMPVAAYVSALPDGFRLVAMLADETGQRLAFADEPLPSAAARDHVAEIARRLAIEVGFASGARSWPGSESEPESLRGLRVVVTRPKTQADALIAALRERGARPLPLPTIRVEEMADSTALDAALCGAGAGAFRWIAFTSANAVSMVASRLSALGLRPQETPAAVAAVGPATAAAATDAGFDVALVPRRHDAEALAAALRARMQAGDRVLYPRSAIGRDTLLTALRSAGADVVAVAAYRTLPEPDVDPQVLAQVRRGQCDVVLFASPSSVRCLIDLLGEDRHVLDGVDVICAGPATAAAARLAGIEVSAVSDDPGTASLIEAIASLRYGSEGLDPPLASAAPMSESHVESDAPILTGRSAN